MDNETIEDFARYRLNKAKETLETAKMIFNEEKDAGRKALHLFCNSKVYNFQLQMS